MATADSGASNLARLENMAIVYLDSFIDARQKSLGTSYLAPLVSFQGHVGCGTNAVRAYIGQKKKEVEDFITLRPHIWKVRASNAAGNAAKILVVEKQPAEVRAVLVRVLAYVQRKTEETGQGAKLNNVSVLIGQHHPQIKKILGFGLHGVKTFLHGYSNLFQLVPYDVERTDIGDILFKNRATVVDGVILLSTTTATQSNSTRLQGVGPIVRLFPAYGFVRDDKTKEEAYFTMHVLQGINEETFRRLAMDGEKFSFEAFISRDYETGKTGNKWSVSRMCRQSSTGSSSGSSEATASSSSLASGSSSNTKMDVVCSVWDGESLLPNRLGDKTKFGGKINGAGPALLTEELDEVDVDGSQSPINLLQQSIPAPQYLPQSKLLFRFDSEPTAAVGSSQPVLESKRNLRQGGTVSAAKNEKTAAKNELTTPVTKLDVIPKTSASQKNEKLPESTRKSSQRSHQVSLSNAKAVEKCEVGCQTEFNDERELLLRLLRRSPDLLKLVKVVRGANE